MNPLTKTTYALMVLAIILAIPTSCNDIPKAPLIVTGIHTKDNIFCCYDFRSQNAGEGAFIDSCGKYNIGDTIK